MDTTHCCRRRTSCLYTRYAQIDPVVSNTRQNDSGVHGISTTPPLLPPMVLRRAGWKSRSDLRGWPKYSTGPREVTNFATRR